MKDVEENLDLNRPRSSDPRFKPREKSCSRCGRTFETTGRRRMLCLTCFETAGRNPGAWLTKYL